MKYPILLVLSC